MNLPTRDEIKEWIKMTDGVTRQSVADVCEVAKTTVDQWLSKKEIPIAQHARIARLMNPQPEITETSKIVLTFSDEHMELISNSADAVNTPLLEFCKRSVIARSRQVMASIDYPEEESSDELKGKAAS